MQNANHDKYGKGNVTQTKIYSKYYLFDALMMVKV